ncbi:hypothetical protein AC579_340 [Pseudocercospora musae]|uniref:Aquaporin n=1 Tax=Pseudocercospora musae TaxID=113226 RepID=A0A139IRG6_9PEZI|nr:hypothetical protein AC579_340 [Pseudocercospora musae]KXT17193.1 hypothetical protein AC579_340 [Pseudocercospora musae]
MEGKLSFGRPMAGVFQPREHAKQSPARNHFVAATGEFVGTFMFLFFAYLGHSMSVATASDSGRTGGNSNSTIIYISMSYGLSLLVTAWALYRVSGGLFNPAVTLGLVITGQLPAIRGVIFFPTQILGGVVAAAVASVIIPGDIAVTQTTLADGMSKAQGVFLEMFLTAYLVFAILMLAAEKSKATFIAPIGIGLALFVAQIAGVHYTGASLNPARSFGPCVAAAKFQGYHWIYWVGPFLGAMIAGGYFHFVKFFNYYEANPGQDSAGGGFADDIDVAVRERQRIPSSSTA